ncbi:uncharacterized protein [Medicago truncatula]|uniref:Transmembrane protein, putative n=1 Tax=Medicago truncatula TaxID=3880 RepID=A0A072TUK3_MEDTR|nr:uncharacterized protein LOC25502168 [Medicago truncatula]KEH21204.1 transmembrane protein, putative [Medicago truncatula]
MASSSALNLPVLSLCKSPKFIKPSTTFLQRDFHLISIRTIRESNSLRKRAVIVCGLPLGVDPWAPSIDSQSIASQLFAFSLFPYIGFLYFITKSKTSPNLTLFGFYFLLAFVGATIPAGIYAKVHYGTSLSNVDWLHGGAESLLTLTNLFIVLGLREGIRKAENSEKNTESKEEKKPGMKV